MSLSNVPAGKDVPNDFNVIIEIPMRGEPIKFEVDKESGAIFVDRFMGTSMHYPCNYGYIPQTLSEDGDPTDVLVITPIPLQPGVVIRCRAIGVLMMEDESGMDEKILAVPTTKLDPYFANIKSYKDLPEVLINRIKHFFESYKALEKGKWVKVGGWEDEISAKKIIQEGLELAKK